MPFHETLEAPLTDVSFNRFWQKIPKTCETENLKV